MKNAGRWLASALLASMALSAHGQYSAQFIESSKAWGSAVADFDGDGHDDFLISGHDTDDRIWYWTATGYVPGPQTLVWVDRHDCDAADFNRDGRMDLYCTVGADKGLGEGPNELWLQGSDGWLTQVPNHGAEDRYGSGRLPIVLDFNHDGWPDVFVTNERRDRPDGQPSINRLFLNQGGSHFVEATTIATGEFGWSCVAKGDIDGDGWDDLLVCDDQGPPHIYMNNRAGDFTLLDTPAAAVKWRLARLAGGHEPRRAARPGGGDGHQRPADLAQHRRRSLLRDGRLPEPLQLHGQGPDGGRLQP